MSKIAIIPAVLSYVDKKKKVNFKKLHVNEEMDEYHQTLLEDYLDEQSSYKLLFIPNKKIKKQAYQIHVNQNGIKVYYSDKEGKHNSILTLKQLFEQIDNLTTCIIKDEPNFEIRSVMIDISRNKVPTRKTLEEIVDQLALAKINDLQLYIEGRSFYFDTYPQFYDNKEDFLTGEDVVYLREYALQRGITLTPNTNCFGHMAFWLNQKEFNHLALFKEGFTWSENGLWGYPATIDPTNQEAKQFVYQLFEDLLKYYPNCSYFTIGGDEPFELLFPKKLDHARELYENHMMEVIDYVNQKGILPCMWGDVVKEYPEMLDKFNRVLFLEWGYEAGHFNDEKCQFYREHQKDFMVCCGTSGWLSISGRMDNMMKNYYEAAYYGKKYHAKGMMITDWNDGGSFSQLVTQQTCYIYGACYAWNYKKVNQEEVNRYLDDKIYHTNLAEYTISLGQYVNIQENASPNMTRLFLMLFCCQIDGINFDIHDYSDCAALFSRQDVLTYDECLKTKIFLDNWIYNYKPRKKNSYSKELLFSYRLIRHALNLNFVYIKLKNITCKKQEIKELLSDIQQIIRDYKKIWFVRNKKSDFHFSIYRLQLLKKKYLHVLELMGDDE